jgi:hypothetical protein
MMQKLVKPCSLIALPSNPEMDRGQADFKKRQNILLLEYTPNKPEFQKIS